MQKSFWYMALFTGLLIGGFIYLGSVITNLSGEKGELDTSTTGVNPEGGETIFWGKGQCHTCHSIGKKGSGIRGPNLGGIGERAAERAKERVAKGKTDMTATGYLIESLATPDAYVVKGFKAEMPFVYKAPIALSPDEVKAVISYLQSQEGEVNIAEIVLPAKIMDSVKSGGEEVAEWKPYLDGEPAVGEALFFDLKGDVACAKCHTVKGKGEKVGPELTTVAATRSPQYIIESILKPSAVIASGFEPVKVKTKIGKIFTGILKEDNEEHVLLMDSAGKITEIPRADVKKLKLLKTSVMPPFGNVINMEDFHNLLAYLLTLK
ncbi:MAG: c-type cytochrome [Candidatus Anammoxibacter sp.]